MQLVKKAQLNGFEVILIFLSLPSPAMAKQRVAQRVLKGGHNIPDEVVERRFSLGIKNLFEFIAIVDRWHVYENINSPPMKIAPGERDGSVKIINLEVWKKLKNT